MFTLWQGFLNFGYDRFRVHSFRTVFTKSSLMLIVRRFFFCTSNNVMVAISDPKAKVETVKSLLDALPKPNRSSLGVIMYYLSTYVPYRCSCICELWPLFQSVCANAAVNKMSAVNLATCMGPAIMASREFNSGGLYITTLKILLDLQCTRRWRLERFGIDCSSERHGYLFNWTHPGNILRARG